MFLYRFFELMFALAQIRFLIPYFFYLRKTRTAWGNVLDICLWEQVQYVVCGIKIEEFWSSSERKPTTNDELSKMPYVYTVVLAAWMCIQPENMLFSLSDPADSPAVFWEGSFVSRTFALSFECRMKDAMHETDRFESQRSKNLRPTGWKRELGGLWRGILWSFMFVN